MCVTWKIHRPFQALSLSLSSLMSTWSSASHSTSPTLSVPCGQMQTPRGLPNHPPPPVPHRWGLNKDHHNDKGVPGRQEHLRTGLGGLGEAESAWARSALGTKGRPGRDPGASRNLPLTQLWVFL